MKLGAFGLWAFLITAPLAGAPLIEGPASVSLGAEALLSLPEGWRWVPKEALAAYFAPTKRVVGAWDLGVLLTGTETGSGQGELRLQFEPLGAVELGAPLDVEALLAKAQAAAVAEGQRRQRVGLAARELTAWRWEPNYQPEAQVLRFGGLWTEGEQQQITMHLRWLGRAGAIKLDWKGDEEQAYPFTALTEQLDEALSFVPGRTLADRAASDPVAKAGLEGLVMEGLFGRGVLAGGKQEPETPLYAWVMAALLGAAALAWLALKLWRALSAWLKARARAKDDEQRLGYYEKKLGSRAGDVELEEDEKQEGY